MIPLQINQKVRNVQISGTVRLAQRARELAAAGTDIIDLTEGQSYHNTPLHIIEAAHASALKGQTKYTPVPGLPELRDAIAQRINNQNGTGYSADNIVVGCGGKHLIFNAMMISLEPGDEVIVPAPYWVSYPEIVKLGGGTPILVDCPSTTGFKITPTQLANAISPRTRWLVLNSPGNPTGSIYARDELEQIAHILRMNSHVSVLSDDIYEAIVFDAGEFCNLTTVAPDLTARVLTVSGVSKAYAMTGWRIGYCAGELPFIREMIKFQGQSTTNPSTLGQIAALEALTGSQDCVDQWRAEYQHSRDVFINLLEECHGLDINRPDGAFYLFVGCDRLFGPSAHSSSAIKTDYDFCDYLLETALVSTIPGSEFGCPGFFRLCFAKPLSTLRHAARRIETALSALQ